MTTLNILSKEEIERFESPPWFTAEERKHFFTLPDWAENTVKKFATPASKIGFILQLGYFRATNMFYPKNLFCPQDIEFVQKRLGFEDIWRETEYSVRMMQRHRLLILTKLNYKVFSPGATPALFTEAASMVEKQLRLKDIFDRLLEWLEQKRIEVPRYHSLSAIITRAFRQYEKRMLNQLETCLTEEDKKLLDTLLTVDEKIYESSEKQAVTLKRPRVTLLKKFHQSTRPGKIKANISDLLLIKEFFTRFEPVCQKLQLSTQVIEHYATITIKVQYFQIERRNEQRYLYLLCFISHQYYTLQDMLIETLLKVAQTATNNAKKVQQETYFAARDNRLEEANELMKACESADTIVEKVKHIVLLENIPAEEKLIKLKAVLQKNREYSSKETRQLVSLQRVEQKRAAMNADYFDSLQSQSLKGQNRLLKNVCEKTMKESRQAYVANLTEKIREIMTFCYRHEVDLVVFPEYSVPLEALEALSAFSNRIAIIAGLGRLRRTDIKIAQDMNIDVKGSAPGNNVAVVLSPNKNYLIAKKHPAEKEDIQPGKGPITDTLELQKGVFTVGVAICLDFIQEKSLFNQQMPDLVAISQLPQHRGR
jgi:uncharacterized protein DUF4158